MQCLRTEYDVNVGRTLVNSIALLARVNCCLLFWCDVARALILIGLLQICAVMCTLRRRMISPSLETCTLLCVLLARQDNAGPRCRETDTDAEASHLPELAFLAVFVGPGVDRSRFATAALSYLDITAH